MVLLKASVTVAEKEVDWALLTVVWWVVCSALAKAEIMVDRLVVWLEE